MLADQLDYVVGVDPHRDSHALAVVDVRTGAVVFESAVAANGDGYARALELVDVHASGRRAFAVEGSGSFGAGLTRFLSCQGERVLEVGRLRRERRSGGKTDALDAVRAARSVLAQERPATPRAGGERQALQALVAAREGAVNAKCAGLGQLRDLLITTPEPLRSELRQLTPAPLLRRLAATRPETRRDPELRGSLLALRSIARRVLQLTAEERELARQIEALTRKLAPQLLDQPGVGPHSAAQLILSWSHPPRPDQIRSRLRPTRRRRTAPRLIRTDDPAPTQSWRRQTTQPRPAYRDPSPTTARPNDQGLHRTPRRRRQNNPRRRASAQALPRPPPLPTTSTGAADGLTRHRSIIPATRPPPQDRHIGSNQ